MKFIIQIFTLFAIVSSCSVKPEGAINLIEEKAFQQVLNESDSIDIWATQWQTCFELGSIKAVVSQSIYGVAVIIHNDSLYFLSSGLGYYGSAEIDVNNEHSFLHENILKSIEVFEDSMFIQFDDYYKVHVSDTGKYTLVTSYIKRTVSSKEVLKTFKEGKLDTPDWQRRVFLGLDVSNWVEIESPWRYKIK
ncbi:MAG: hypothetical protein HRT58_00465 [Crocinitomicaceae bacterium]|nr:hypothetical protein [Flavobacteriales bacterium]NQZ34094.1 hypothetical protein [Crocinitomicaceae bacterium]